MIPKSQIKFDYPMSPKKEIDGQELVENDCLQIGPSLTCMKPTVADSMSDHTFENETDDIKIVQI